MTVQEPFKVERKKEHKVQKKVSRLARLEIRMVTYQNIVYLNFFSQILLKFLLFLNFIFIIIFLSSTGLVSYYSSLFILEKFYFIVFLITLDKMVLLFFKGGFRRYDICLRLSYTTSESRAAHALQKLVLN